MTCAGAATLVCVLAGLIAPAEAQAGAGLEGSDQAICHTIDGAAGANGLPAGFLTRVIWRESSFRSAVVSPAGAEGIAQFMPDTASSRGLRDPFDPEQAIPKAARLLADLRRRFGNLGLAAAAYNAGANRVTGWLEGGAALPAETRAYVRLITEREVGEWGTAGGKPSPDLPDPGEASCLAVVGELRREGDPALPLAPWGVQLAGNFVKGLALTSFGRARRRYAAVIGGRHPMIIGRLLRSRGTRRFYEVRLPAASREEAEALCSRIQAQGGACAAMRS